MGALLGADEFGFGTVAMIATGCIMARVCHTNNCPVGVASQREELRARFPGAPEDLVNFFHFVAEEVSGVCVCVCVCVCVRCIHGVLCYACAVHRGLYDWLYAVTSLSISRHLTCYTTRGAMQRDCDNKRKALDEHSLWMSVLAFVLCSHRFVPLWLKWATAPWTRWWDALTCSHRDRTQDCQRHRYAEDSRLAIAA